MRMARRLIKAAILFVSRERRVDSTIVLGLGDSKTVGVGDDDESIGYLPVLAASVGLESTPRLAVSGATVAYMASWVPANIGAQNRTPDYVLCNLGANDSSSLPAKATWIADYSTIIDTVLAEWPDTQIYIAKPWVQTNEANCNTIAKWIDELVASYGANVDHGIDERIFLENWGSYATYSDGVHPNHAGYALTAAEWKKVIVPPSAKFMLRLFTTASGTFAPSVTESSDSGVYWVVSGETTQTTPTPSFSLDGTQRTVDIYAANPERITAMDINTKSLVGTSKLIQLTNFTNLATLSMYGNGGLNFAGELYDLPPALVTLFGWGCTNTQITGRLCDAPASLVSIYLDNSSSAIVGGDDPIQATGIGKIVLSNTGMTQAGIDSVLERIYTDWSTLTDTTPELDVAGSNPSPSGTLQDATPPTTGLEYAYKLVNDPDSTGYPLWSITYTS